MKGPKVSVICLCHNQANYVSAAMQSVLDQTYPNIELVVVDDGSDDRSKEIIQKFITNTSAQYIAIPDSIGNCKAFNRGLKIATGEYIIDLAADDVLLPTRVEKGINTFEEQEIGVEFCNVQNIDSDGQPLNVHFTADEVVPEGDIYKELIERYFISPPGMMTKKAVFDDLGGYDENLTYEDFDFWIRSSRRYTYGYTNKILVQKRDVANSLSKAQFQFKSAHQKSTLAVCQKIKRLNKTKQEDAALRRRCLYEIKNCLKQGNLYLIPSFLRLCY